MEKNDSEKIRKDTVLVVDDEEVILHMIRILLENAGYQVETAIDYHHAENLLLRMPFDLVFTDIVMPDINGIQVLKKTIELQPDTPVVLITGDSNLEMVTEAVRLNAYDFLTKPITTTTLIRVAKRATETKKLREVKRRVEKENWHYRENLERLVKERTQELWVSEERYRTLFEESKDAIFITDRNGKFVELNQSATDLFGAAKDEMLKMNSITLCVDHQERKRLIADLKENGYARDFEIKLRKKNGTVMDCLVTTSLLRNSDEITICQGIIRDVTEKKWLESVVEAANLMENIGYIFSGIRHELGNPINSIKIALDILYKNLNTFNHDTVRQFVERSLNQVRRVEYLLNVLRNFSMFETPQVRDVNTSFFLENFLSIASADIEKDGITIETDFSPDARRMLTDPRALQQILLNLVINAAEALENNQESARIMIRTRKMPGLVQIIVEDNGCGIPQSQQKNLFRPFFTSKPHGTGLGLVLVKKMLAKMNGVIDIQSRQNIGTTVTLSIPKGKM